MLSKEEAARERTRKEAAAGQKAARKFTGDLRRVQKKYFKDGPGKFDEISAAKRMRKGKLWAIAIKAPKYGYIQHYGFIGTKSNGVVQRLKATEFISEAVRGGAIDVLADEIGDIRALEVVANIDFL